MIKKQKPRHLKNNNSISQEAENTIKKTLRFSQHMAQFSKLLSFLFVSMYGVTWLVYLVIVVMSYFESGIFQTNVLDFILQPTQIILGFYFGTKMFENVSQIVCKAYLKKQGFIIDEVEI